MEKRRRARINASLLELKSLLLETIKKEGARHNKMEKADILEMAVKHLRQIHKQPATGESSSDQTVVTRYSLGFNACVQEVSQYLDENVELKTKLLNHLANCMTQGHFPNASRCPSSSSGGSSSSSYLETSPHSSSSSLPAPSSPRSLSSVSPSSTTLSPESQRSLSVDVKGISLVSRKNLEFIEEKPKIYGGVSQMVGSSQTQRSHQGSVSPFLRTKLTASALPTVPDLETYTVLVNPNQVPTTKPGCGDSNNNDSLVRDSYDTVQVPEINNNNTITLPAATLLGIRSAATTLPGVQPQHIQIQPLQIQQTASVSAAVDQPPQTYLQDASSLISNTNRLLLIPTKTSTGENAYVLSANFINPNQFSGYTIPVFNPQNQAPIFAAPFQQQAIQIAVSYSQEDQQRHTLVPHLPQIQTAMAYPFEMTPDNHLEKQAAPLNLTSTSHQTFPVSLQHVSHRSTPFPLVTSSTVGPHSSSPKPTPTTVNKPPPLLAPQIDTNNDEFIISDATASSNQLSSLHNSARIGISSTSNGAFGMAAFQPFMESSNQVSSSSSTVLKQHSRDSTSPYRHFPREETLRYQRDKPHEYHKDLSSEDPNTDFEKPMDTKQANFFRPW